MLVTLSRLNKLYITYHNAVYAVRSFGLTFVSRLRLTVGLCCLLPRMEYLQQIRDKFSSPEVPYTRELEEPGTNDDECVIRLSKNRSSTDVPFLALQGGFTLIFLFLLGYCIANGDIQRLTKRYDNCGNICGKVNKFDLPNNSVCKAMDMEDKPFLYVNGLGRTCVKSCSPNTIVAFGESCIPKDRISGGPDAEFLAYVNTIYRNLRIYSRQIIYLSLIAVAFSFVILLLLRYMAEAFVWTVLIGTIATSVVGSCYMGYLASYDAVYTACTVFLVGLTVGLIIVIKTFWKQIPLVIQLFKESQKSISAIPILLFQPILTFITLAIVWSAWLDFTLWIESAGTPVVENDAIVVFHQNFAMQLTRWYNHVVMLWMVQFVYGCQSMLLAGAVSAWFFTRDKSKLDKPVFNSAYNMMKYHLGTISFGSLIIVAIQLMRILLAIVSALLRRILNFVCLYLVFSYVDAFFSHFERLTKCLTKNAYTITAIHGYPFKKGGKLVVHLLVDNVRRFLSINSVGTIVSFFAKVLIMAATVGIATVLINDTVNSFTKTMMMIIIGVLAYLIAHCFLSVNQMAVDTIFVCFCEDSQINDGMSRPYFMSQDLIEFVDKCKVVVILKNSVHNVQHV